MNEAASSHSVRIEIASSNHEAGLAALFGATHTGCYCRYWHFGGDKNAWQVRCAQEPDLNEAELRAALRAGSEEAQGFVALAGADVVGWLKLTPATHLHKLYDQRTYRGLPCFAGDRSGVYTIGCFLVAEPWRRQGVARALLAAATGWAREHGLRAIEAFPRRGSLLRPADLWLGPPELYFEAGFVEAHAFAPYPVLRLSLESRHDRA